MQEAQSIVCWKKNPYCVNTQNQKGHYPLPAILFIEHTFEAIHIFDKKQDQSLNQLEVKRFAQGPNGTLLSLGN